MKQNEIWLMLFHANISGYTATTAYGHGQEIMNHVAQRTDYALQEYNKRWERLPTTPFGWWDLFNEQFVKSPEVAKKLIEGGNTLIPLRGVSHAG